MKIVPVTRWVGPAAVSILLSSGWVTLHRAGLTGVAKSLLFFEPDIFLWLN